MRICIARNRRRAPLQALSPFHLSQVALPDRPVYDHGGSRSPDFLRCSGAGFLAFPCWPRRAGPFWWRCSFGALRFQLRHAASADRHRRHHEPALDLFFGAVKLANISICLAGMATTSFFTAFTEPPLERRRVRPLEVLLGLLMVAGIPLVAGFERVHLAGLLIALAGALVAAIFPVMNRRLVMKEKMDPFMMVVWEMAGASAICIRLSSREPPPFSLQTSPIR